MSITEIPGDDVVFAETVNERELINLLREMGDADKEQLLRMAQLYAKEKTPD